MAAITDYWTLAEAAVLPLLPEDLPLAWGEILVVAPHPDDESLGCGGVIHRLRQAGRRVEIAVLTDGRNSHPNSQEYSTHRLVELRRHELHTAAHALGVPSQHLHFLNLEDAHVPPPESTAGVQAVKTLRAVMQSVQTVLVTWRGDPHCDHAAAFAYVQAAAQGLPVQVVEYPVWVWQNGTPEQAPHAGEFTMLRVDIRSSLEAKRRAIAAHASQVSTLIQDDPAGFTVPPEMLAHFAQPWELFIQRR